MLKRTLVLLLIAATTIFFTPALAGAQEIEGEDGIVEVVTQISVNATIVFLLIQLVLPFVNGLILKAQPRAWVAQLVSSATAALSGFVTAATQTDGSAIFTPQALLFAVVAWLIQVASYNGLWKPHNVNERTGSGLVG